MNVRLKKWVPNNPIIGALRFRWRGAAAMAPAQAPSAMADCSSLGGWNDHHHHHRKGRRLFGSLCAARALSLNRR